MKPSLKLSVEGFSSVFLGYNEKSTSFRRTDLVFANSDTASGVRNTLRSAAGGLEVGPILMGMDNKAHIVTPSVTARGLLNIAAIAGTPT